MQASRLIDFVAGRAPPPAAGADGDDADEAGAEVEPEEEDDDNDLASAATAAGKHPAATAWLAGSVKRSKA